ncbi:hypothetical protein EBB07_10730 [Paenibacillaceae bacterium]|nr:hypothetical protein EBB07_10730 [Paenibacillaceae bacterium]
MNKQKRILIGLVSLVVLISLILFWTNHNKIDRENRLKLESVVGHSLYQIWNNYSSISDMNSSLTETNLSIMLADLKRVDIYSGIVDQVVEKSLLKRFSEKMLNSAQIISQNYEKSGEFSDIDRTMFLLITEKSKAFLPHITSIYYKRSEEGKVKFKISDYSELEELIDSF